jgi:hypothetical protein
METDMLRFARMLLSTAAAAAVGMLVTVAVAAPASAAHPETEPKRYFAGATGEDNCTHFHTSGQIRWHATHPGERPTISVKGSNAIAVPGLPPDGPNPCLPHPVEDRQVEFSAFGADFPLGTEIVPFPTSGSGQPYEFDFSARIDIDTVEVAVCLPRRADGSTWPSRCGEPMLVHRDGGPTPGGIPQPFEYSSTGMDGCTKFAAEGVVRWADGSQPASIIGSAASTFEGIVIEPGGPVVCMPAYVYPRKIEFSAYSGNTLVATRAEWFTRDAPNEFAFALPDAPARSADRIVIEICEYNDLVNPPERSSCSELTTVEPDEPASAPYCEYRFEVVTFGTGFLTNVGVTPLETTSSTWRLEADFPGDFTITSVWNAEWTRDGSTVVFTPPPWGAVLQPGATLWVGFLGTGTPPNEVRLTVDGRPCVAAA